MENLNFIYPEIFISLGIMFLLILGVFKKLVIADNLAVYVDWFFSLKSYDLVNAFTAWLAVLAYAAQIFADFSGYTDCSIPGGGYVHIPDVNIRMRHFDPRNKTIVLGQWRWCHNQQAWILNN